MTKQESRIRRAELQARRAEIIQEWKSYDARIEAGYDVGGRNPSDYGSRQVDFAERLSKVDAELSRLPDLRRRSLGVSVLVISLLALAASSYVWFSRTGDRSAQTIPSPPTPTPAEIAAKAQQAEQSKLIDDCRTNIAQQTAAYHKLMSKRDYQGAADTIRRCAQVLPEPEPKALLVAAVEIKSYIADIENPKNRPFDRAVSIALLSKSYPEYGKKYQSLKKTLEAAAEQQRRKYERDQAAAEAREEAKRDPILGDGAGVMCWCTYKSNESRPSSCSDPRCK